MKEVSVVMNMKIRDSLYKKVEKAFAKQGLDFNSAFSVYVRETAKQGKIPFELPIDEDISDKELAHIDKLLDETGIKFPN